MSLKVLDLFFIIFHTALILFNLFGWVLKSTRQINLITLLLTGISWSLLGIIYGFGYCPLTDWHWQVLEKMGEPVYYTSYVQYLFSRMLGMDLTARTADALTLILFGASLLCSAVLNYTSRHKRRA